MSEIHVYDQGHLPIADVCTRHVELQATKRTRQTAQATEEKGFRGYPVVTVAFYGPDDQHASKAVASLIRHEGGDIEDMKKWYATEGDVRHERGIQAEMLAYFADANPKSIVKPDRIIGCPHEEGIDYPEGESCPECPFWKNRNRFTGQTEH